MSQGSYTFEAPTREYVKDRRKFALFKRETYHKEEIEDETSKTLISILSEPIDKNCLAIMKEYTEEYIETEKANKTLNLEKYLPSIQADFVILTSILEKFDKKHEKYTLESLKETGVTACTIKTGLQRKWLSTIIKKIRKLTTLEKTDDFKKYGFFPGEHLFYYGAFTGRVTRSVSPATHHFVYLYKGIVMEVGAEIEDCIGSEQVAMSGPVAEARARAYAKIEREAEAAAARSDTLLGSTARVTRDVLSKPGKLFDAFVLDPMYKSKMNYFGFSTIYKSAVWMEDYGQTEFYGYDYGNNSDVDIVIKRLERAMLLIGRWSYSLLGSNNCENAANFIALGHSLSTQSCKLDMAINSLYQLRLPIIDAARTYEYDIITRSDIPQCVEAEDGKYDESRYSNRYVTKKNKVCIGGLNIGLGIMHPNCKIDKEYCKHTGRKACPETETVTDKSMRKVCYYTKGNDPNKLVYIFPK
jgi:hypothetical protein